MERESHQKEKEAPLSDDSYFDDTEGFSEIDEKRYIPPGLSSDRGANFMPPKEMNINELEQHDQAIPRENFIDNISPHEIIESLMPHGHTIFNPPRTIASLSSMSSAPAMLSHINAIQTISLTHVSAITKEDPEYILLLNSVSLIIAIEQEKNRIFSTLLEVYGSLFPELGDISQAKDEYIQVASVCGTKFLQEQVSEEDHDHHNKIIENLLDFLPSQQVALLITLASITKGTNHLSAPILENIDQFLLSAADEIRLLEEIKQIFLDHLSQRIHLYLPNMSNLIGPSITAQLFGIVGGRVDKIIMMNREEVMKLGSPYQDSNQTSDDLTGLPTGYVANSDLVLFAKDNPMMDAYTVQKVIKAVASKVVLAARVDLGRYAPDGEKGFLMKKAVIRRINRLEKDITDKERRRLQNYENRRRLMDDIQSHREEMRLNRQVYGKESTIDSDRAFDLWKNSRQQELAEYNATLYSNNRGRMTAKQYGRHQQLVAISAAARVSGMTVAEYEENQRELERNAERDRKKGFRRVSERNRS